MTFTQGNIIVENIKIGDIHYEFFYSFGVKSQVLSLPTRTPDGIWHWRALNLTTNKEFDYVVNEKYSHYSVNLYDSIVYDVNIWL